MKKFSLYILGIVALAGPLLALTTLNEPTAALATTTTFVADTKTAVTASNLVNGGRYIFCQYAVATSKYEVMNGAANGTKQIAYTTPDYSTLADLKTGANSVASRYVTLTSAGGSNWYIRRCYDSKYLVSNGDSDLTFSSSSTYSSTNRCYFVPIVGSSSDLIRFYISDDSTLYLGTKSGTTYFDTWHDQTSSVATKDFILYHVYTVDEEANNYASSFNDTLSGICATDGSTSVSALRTAWSTMSTNWNDVSTISKSSLKNAVANSSLSADVKSRFKAKYLYIANKYRSDAEINDFMGVRTASLSDSALLNRDDTKIITLATIGVLSIAILSTFFVFSKKHHKILS